WPVVRVFRTGEAAFSVRVFRTGFGTAFPYRFFVFLASANRTARGSFAARAASAMAWASSIVLILRHSCVGGDAPPPPPWAECQEQPVGLPVIGVAASTALHADEAKCLRLTDGWRNGVVIHTVVHEVLLRDRQVAVLAAAVAGVLDLDPGYDSVGGHAQHPVC